MRNQTSHLVKFFPFCNKHCPHLVFQQDKGCSKYICTINKEVVGPIILSCSKDGYPLLSEDIFVHSEEWECPVAIQKRKKHAKSYKKHRTRRH
jgi:hypothetical protein